MCSSFFKKVNPCKIINKQNESSSSSCPAGKKDLKKTKVTLFGDGLEMSLFQFIRICSTVHCTSYINIGKTTFIGLKLRVVMIFS